MSKSVKKVKYPEGGSDRIILNRAACYLRCSATLEKFSLKQWKEDVEHFWKGKCAYCRKPASPLEKEHVIPVNRNGLGLSQNGNTVPACRDCNTKKRHFDKQDDGCGYVKFCEQEGHRAGLAKIKEYMKDKGYKPLVKDKATRKRIAKMICKAYKDIAVIREKYAKKIAGIIKREKEWM